MRKIWAFLLLGMFSLCTTAAEAKVCFLPNVLIGGKCVSLSKAKYNDCKGFTETTPCESVGKETIESCTNDNGTTYYKCGCRGDVISWDVINQHPGWICETGYSQECGCSAEHISCTYEYKYLGDGTGKCAKTDENDNSRGVGACALPNGRVYYKDCNCNGYPYECDSMTGLKAPTGAGDTTVGCKSPHNTNYKYKECECANGWTSGSCESNANGCLMPISYVTANDGELTCALCDERLCRANGESNLETVYCAPKKVNGVQTYGGEYLTRTITDCVDLGFVQGATGGFCPAGTQKAGEVGVKCPFDGRYMFCENKEGCYPTQDACELADSVKECKEVGGCYRVYECNEGYKLNENLGICMIAECPEGFTTEALHCDDAEHGIMHGYNGSPYQQGTSGEADCKQCECDIELARSEGYCKYTNNASGNGGTLIGEGIASVPCCDGSYSECSFPFGTTTPSEGVKTHERHEACGETYYVPKDCLEGYIMKNGDCKLVGCANEYSTSIQSAKDCTNGFQGTIGWKVEAQKVDNKVDNKVIQSGGQTCNKCECITEGLGCSWNVSNKGKFGRLDEKTACCDGTYKSCVANLCSGSGSDDLTEDSDPTNDCIPNSATVALCSAKPAHAISMKKYEACGQETRCLVRQCEPGYRPSDDGKSCVEFTSCEDAHYTSNTHSGDPAWSCKETLLTQLNGEKCYRCACSSGYAETQPGVCTRNCENGYATACPYNANCIEIDGCYKKTGCKQGYHDVGSDCYPNTCAYYGYQDKCAENQQEVHTATVPYGDMNITCYLCQDLENCDYKQDRYYSYYGCNVRTGSDCVLEDGDFCYTPGGEGICSSYENDSDTAGKPSPCDGEPTYSYTEKCGRYWTGECYDRFDEASLSSYLYVQPIIEKIKTVFHPYENWYITIDDIEIDVTISGEDSYGRSSDLGTGQISLYGTVLHLDDPTLLAEYPYYYVKVNGIRATVSEHMYQEKIDSPDAVGAYMLVISSWEDVNPSLIDDNKLVKGDHFIRRGQLELTDEVFDQLGIDMFTGGKCELTRRYTPDQLDNCMVAYSGQDGEVDRKSKQPYVESYCGNCFMEQDQSEDPYYAQCDEEMSRSLCLSSEDPRWIHIVSSTSDMEGSNWWNGDPYSVEENIAYIFIVDKNKDEELDNDMKIRFYEDYLNLIEWQE